MSVPHRLFVSKLMPTDGWEHPEQPVTDSPLPNILQVLHRMSSAKTSYYGMACWGQTGTKGRGSDDFAKQSA